MEIKVYETRKYSVFKKLEGNRDLCSVKKIVDSINKVGYIPSPVCVNENMEVIDGQNRIEALKQLGMPVHYYIVNGIGLEEARQMNIGRKNWQLIDYFKSFAAEGKEEYVYFLKMLEKHNRYRLLELWSIYYGATNGRGTNHGETQSGNLGFGVERMNEVEYLFAYLDAMYDSLKKIPGYTSQIIPTFAWVLQLPKVDKKRVVDVVNRKYPLFVPAVSAEITLNDFSKHYNSKLSPEKRIFFDSVYKEWLNNKLKTNTKE